jgi:phage tail tape-measure protein
VTPTTGPILEAAFRLADEAEEVAGRVRALRAAEATKRQLAAKKLRTSVQAAKVAAAEFEEIMASAGEEVVLEGIAVNGGVFPFDACGHPHACVA